MVTSQRAQVSFATLAIILRHIVGRMKHNRGNFRATLLGIALALAVLTGGGANSAGEEMTTLHSTSRGAYSVLGRIDHGDTVADLLADNPDLSRKAIEAAIIYARAHPLMGRPGGRPWVEAA